MRWFWWSVRFLGIFKFEKSRISPSRFEKLRIIHNFPKFSNAHNFFCFWRYGAAFWHSYLYLIGQKATKTWKSRVRGKYATSRASVHAKRAGSNRVKPKTNWQCENVFFFTFLEFSLNFSMLSFVKVFNFDFSCIIVNFVCI